MGIVELFYSVLTGLKSFITPIMEHSHVKQCSPEDHHYLSAAGRKPSSCKS